MVVKVVSDGTKLIPYKFFVKPWLVKSGLFLVRPAGRFYLVVQVHYGPGKGNH